MPGARNFFTNDEQEKILQEIASAELRTSGEIRLHIENFCYGNQVARATKVFTNLGMHQTRERNGVLLYIAARSHKVAIVGDQGIHEKLGTQFWEHLVENLIQQFKARHKAEAVIACIKELGEQLSRYFPRRDDDTDELSNEISFG